MTETKTVRFESRKDAWIAVVLWIAVLAQAFAGVVVLVAGGPLWIRLVGGGFCLLMAGFAVWILRSTEYAVGSEELRIRSGPFRWRVPLREIQEVRPTRNPISSPALSLDRLRIRYEGSRFGILLSPVDRERFLAELEARVPGLTREGDGLVRGHGQ